MALSPTNHSAPLVSAPLYEDQYVRLTSDEVAIKWYWFPLGNSKTIHLKDIHQVSLLDLPSFIKRKHWGQGLSKWWWPLDMRRDWRTHFVEIDVGGQPVPAVTCESIHDFFAKLQDATAAAKARAAQEAAAADSDEHGLRA